MASETGLAGTEALTALGASNEQSAVFGASRPQTLALGDPTIGLELDFELPPFYEVRLDTSGRFAAFLFFPFIFFRVHFSFLLVS